MFIIFLKDDMFDVCPYTEKDILLRMPSLSTRDEQH